MVTLVIAEENNSSGVKEDKSRVTVLVCSNAAGTHKCKLLAMGKSAQPRALADIEFLLVTYWNNKNAWIIQIIVSDWFQNYFN